MIIRLSLNLSVVKVFFLFFSFFACTVHFDPKKRQRDRTTLHRDGKATQHYVGLSTYDSYQGGRELHLRLVQREDEQLQ